MQTIHGYPVRAFLGRGKSAYSYRIEYHGQDAVLKDIHHEHVPNYTFQDKLAHEVGGYHRLREAGLMVPKLLHVDPDNEYLIKEYVEGRTLLEHIATGDIATDRYLAYLFRFYALEQQGINLDYFPANFIVTKTDLVYIDYEANEYQPRWDFEHWGIHLWCNTTGCRTYLEDHDVHQLVTQDGDAIVQPSAQDVLDHIHRLDPGDLLLHHDLEDHRILLMQDGMAASTYRLIGPNSDLILKLYDATYDDQLFNVEAASFASYPTLHPPLRAVLRARPNQTKGFLMEYIPSILPQLDLHNVSDIKRWMGPYVSLLLRLHQSATQPQANVHLSVELEAIQPICQSHSVLRHAWNWLTARLPEITPKDAVPIHGDYHPWNVLINDAQQAWLIDRKDRWSDPRYDVYWSAMLMERSGFLLFATYFVDAYRQLDPTIDRDRTFFEVFTSCAWMASVLAKDETPSPFLSQQLAIATTHIEARIK